jgi:hypothetical protein
MTDRELPGGEFAPFEGLSPRQQYRAVKQLADLEPADRLPVLDAMLDLETTRAKTLGMGILKHTAEELPEDALPIIEKGMHDENDRVSAEAVRALATATRTAPEKAIPSLDYAFTRRKKVRTEVGPLVMQLFDSDQESSLPYLIKMADDVPNSYSNTRHIRRAIIANADKIDLQDCSPTPDTDPQPNQWRILLEKELTNRGYSSVELAAGLVSEHPDLAINILVFADKIKDAEPDEEEYSPKIRERSYVGYFLSSSPWRNDNPADLEHYYELIQAHPEAKKYLDRDIERLNRGEFYRIVHGEGSMWEEACDAIPKLKERLNMYFSDHTRRLSDTSDEYVKDREKQKSEGTSPEIFGFGAVDIPGTATPEPGFFQTLDHYKTAAKYQIDEDKLPKNMSQPARAKIRYLKSLFANGDPEEVNDERLKNFLRYHVDESMQDYRESTARIPEWEERFLARLPAGVDMDMARRRISETRITFFDELSALTTWHNKDADGTFDDRNSIVRVNLVKHPISQEKIYTHEMLHAISGRALLFHPATLTFPGSIVNQCTGLRLGHTEKGGLPKAKSLTRFHWLNEAVTEDLAQEMMDGAGQGYYHNERDLLETLRTSGKFDIDPEVFRRAYFENFEPGSKAGERLKHWKELQSQLRQAYGEPILIKIDDIVRESGVIVAINELYEKYRDTSRDRK